MIAFYRLNSYEILIVSVVLGTKCLKSVSY